MIYLSHTAHCQFLGLIFGVLAWIFILTTTGLNDWRMWTVDDRSVITSGVAWVGIWKACFFTHTLPEFETCQSISISDSFIPAEILAAQVLMVLAVISGFAGNICAALAMRKAYFSLEDRRNMKQLFLLAGTLYLLTGGLCLVPLVLNMISVFNNSTIDFPPELYLPAAPVEQRVGTAIGVGILGSIMMLLSGLLFLCYRYAWQTLSSEAPTNNRGTHGTRTETTHRSEGQKGDKQGRDNPAFHREEMS
ncbi:claudin-34 [Notolabrus celidotus]|uniref:claudin-34 n=1 Tax=Notolabrus celidotus TaxID=1203425 RepID=UPI00148FB910|nr:claudin-34 [Notolabrus celidotus]XP_034533528.1 claudin-34 [Notolabrus celidotus]XP_034533537.1 claudin-34 [Notolabrus celidotus]